VLVVDFLQSLLRQNFKKDRGCVDKTIIQRNTLGPDFFVRIVSIPLQYSKKSLEEETINNPFIA
jgi:hypothetical protein